MSTTSKAAEPQEFLDRLRAMVEDRGETWDLSPNDQAAIKFALAELGRVCVLNAEMLEALEAIVSASRVYLPPDLARAIRIQAEAAIQKARGVLCSQL